MEELPLAALRGHTGLLPCPFHICFSLVQGPGYSSWSVVFTRQERGPGNLFPVVRGKAIATGSPVVQHSQVQGQGLASAQFLPSTYFPSAYCMPAGTGSELGANSEPRECLPFSVTG